MKPEAELPVIRAWDEFTIWLLPKIGKFPRDQRFLLGDKIQNLTLGVLDLLISAKFQRDRSGILDNVNVELEKLRFHLRIVHALKLLGTRSYGNAGAKLVDIGTQIGGWKRASDHKGKK